MGEGGGGRHYYWPLSSSALDCGSDSGCLNSQLSGQELLRKNLHPVWPQQASWRGED